METYELIRKLRIEKDLSQDELARKVGYSDRSSIAKIEAGKVDITESKIKTFANVFGVRPSYLLGMDDENDDAPTPQEDERVERIIQLVRLLPQERQDFLIGLIEFELSRVGVPVPPP